MRNAYIVRWMKQPDMNVLTALALQIADQLSKEVAVFMPRNEPAQAIAFIGRDPSLSIRGLSGLLGLSHAATVRLIDRLSQDCIVERSQSKGDARAVALSLTPLGTERYARMLDAQSKVIGDIFGALTSDEQGTFVEIAQTLLSRNSLSKEDAARGCSFCDVVACTNCPVKAEP